MLMLCPGYKRQTGPGGDRSSAAYPFSGRIGIKIPVCRPLFRSKSMMFLPVMDRGTFSPMVNVEFLKITPVMLRR